MQKLTKLLPVLIFTTLAVLPFYVIRCKTFSFCVSPVPFTLLEVLILTTFVVWLIIKLKKTKLKKLIAEINQKVPLILKLLFLIFLVAPLVTVLFSNDKASALGVYKAYFFEPFLLFIVVFDFLLQTKNIKLIIYGLLTSGIWISLLSLFEKIFQFNPFNTFEFMERGRASAVYTTSNAVGLLLGPLVILLIGYFIQVSEKPKEKFLIFKVSETWVLFISEIILLVGIYASGSRGAFLGIFLALTFFCSYLLYSKSNKKIKKVFNSLFKLFTGVFFALIFLFFFNISLISTYSLKNKSSLPPTLVSRVCLWEGAVKLIEKSPIFGTGLSSFQFAQVKTKTCSSENLIYPHNIFLNFWTETGIFGLFSFIGVCLYFFIQLLDSQKVNFLNLGIAAVFIEILFHGLLDVPYFKNDLSVLFWMVLALGLYQINQTKVFTVVVRRLERLKSRHLR